jgi:hypothetical protein
VSNSNPPTSSQHRVEPPYLVVTSKTALPRRCFVTNQPISDSEYQVWSLPSIPRWLWWVTFGSPILLLAYPSLPNRCKIAAGLCRRSRRQRLALKAVLLLILLSPFFLAGAAILTREPHYLVLSFVSTSLAYFALPVLVLLMPPLKVHRKHADLYWISGCSPEFLASLEPGE